MSDEQKQNMQVGRITPISDDDELIDERIPLMPKETFRFVTVSRGTLEAKNAEIARLKEALRHIRQIANDMGHLSAHQDSIDIMEACDKALGESDE